VLHGIKSGGFKEFKASSFHNSGAGQWGGLCGSSLYRLTFADIFAIEGLYSATPKGAFVPGLEFSGSVVAIGSGVKNWKRGDAVIGFNLIWLYYKADKMRALLEESLQAPLGKPQIGITFPFEEMKEVLLHFKSGRTTGKVVIEVRACLNFKKEVKGESKERVSCVN
jgi:NADPH:quinone reductase-like Zn-dependent oxidoreductase